MKMPKLKRSANKKCPATMIDKWVLFPEITIDYETTVVSKHQHDALRKGELSHEAVKLFAYSVQFGLLWQKTDEAGKTENKFVAHLFLDDRLNITEGESFYEMEIHLVHFEEDRTCITAGIVWLEDLFLKRRLRSNANYGGTITAHAFNAGFEESYTIFDLWKLGYTSEKVIPAGYSGVMVSEFVRYKPYVNSFGEPMSRKYTFTIKETARQWAANTTLSMIFDMYGIGEKTETPFLAFTEQGFVEAKTNEPAVIDRKFLNYAAKDVIGLFQALREKRGENGQPKTMTASSTTLLKHEEWFAMLHGEVEYDKYFREASMEADGWLRPYTLGGYNYVAGKGEKGVYQYPATADNNRNFVRFLGIDRTNAYLSCMCFGQFPWGSDVYAPGEYIPDEKFPFYFQKIRIVEALLRPDYMPSLQLKKGTAQDVIRIDWKTSEEERIFVLNKEEIDLFKESYMNKTGGEPVFEYVDYRFYQQTEGEFLFGGYLKSKFYERKDLKKEITQLEKDQKLAPNDRIAREIQQKKARADTLKLMGNGLYGKFFENPNKTQGYWFICPDGKTVQYIEEDTVMEKHSPSHIGSQILRMQRLALIKACNAVKQAGGIIMQCDTDAFLCAVPRAMAERYPELNMSAEEIGAMRRSGAFQEFDADLTDAQISGEIAAKKMCDLAGIPYGEDLGQWHIEKDAREGISVEKKVYAWSRDILTDEERHKTYAELMKIHGKKAFYFGTRGVKKKHATEQLTPLTWRAGAEVETEQFARLAYARRGAVPITKRLALPDKQQEVKNDKK